MIGRLAEMICGKVCFESEVKGRRVIEGDCGDADENGDLV